MKKILVGFFALIILISSPEVFGQESFQEIEQKSVTITIDNEGNVKVVHELRNSKDPSQLTFVDGVVSNVKFMKLGIEESVPEAEGMKNIVLLPNQGNLIVTYDLNDVLIEKNSVWTWDFFYPVSTAFIFPEEVDLLFANERPVFLNDKKGIVCHGCQMLLEYSINDLEIFEDIKWEDKEFIVKINSNSNVDRFSFDQPSKSITFNVSEENRFVATIIPLELLWEPYSVFLNDEKIIFQQYFNNGTHVWVSLVPETSGEITIIGTTVVPEFSMMIPLIMGFLVILTLPFMKKFNLR